MSETRAIVIPVPDDPEGERDAVASHPAFRRLIQESRARTAAGEPGTPIEAFMSEHGIEAAEGRTRKPTGRRPTAGSGKLSLRLPIRLHNELIAQAEREGVSLNTLLVAYLAREAGVEAARGARTGEQVSGG